MTSAVWVEKVLRPYRPRATNDLAAGQYPMSRAAAVEHRYIQHSPYALLGSIVVDVDHWDTAIRAFERPSEHPQPTWVAQSPSGRGHVGWNLTAPVCRTDAARLKPLRFAQRIERGLNISLGGDLAYGGQLTKNPTHEAWETIYGPVESYSLSDLVTIYTPRQMPRRPDRAAGLGRNVTLFDTARVYAYSAWWGHREGTARDWERLIVQRCHDINGEFGSALPFAEVLGVAQSVGRWVWRNFTEEAYRARQARLGRLGGLARTDAKRNGGLIGGLARTDAKRVAVTANGFQRQTDYSAALAVIL